MSKNKIQIYPVIEMSPWRVDGGDDLDLKPDQEFDDFAIEVFKKHGIKQVERLDPYAYSSIRISDIDQSDLKILIEKELNDAEISEYGTELVDAFCGGLVIVNGNSTVINHQCCGSISNFKHWKVFLEKPPQQWEQIWIGHPWIYGRVNSGTLELSDYIEHTGTLDRELPIKMRIELDEFIAEYNKAIKDLKEFKIHIFDVLNIEMADLAKELSELLIENKYD